MEDLNDLSQEGAKNILPQTTAEKLFPQLGEVADQVGYLFDAEG